MGGKGQRRREKNFKAAHGSGYSRLPPPPKPNEVDKLPAKLRRLLDFTNSILSPSTDSTITTTGLNNSNNKKKSNNSQIKDNKKFIGKGDESATNLESKKDGGKGRMNDSSGNSREESMGKDKKKKKRKRNEVNDHRFDTEEGEEKPLGLKKRERQKMYLEAKKNKNKKSKIEEGLTFQGHEEIKFGEVVQAPPKLVAVPKKGKQSFGLHDASQERLRVQTVEAYRNRKAWNSRPGISVPSVINPASSF